MDALQGLARRLVEARLLARSLPEFPGAVPDTLDDAYAVQCAAIALWPDAIAGWKVGRLSADLADRYGVDRFLGPVFETGVSCAVEGASASFAMFAGGSAAFEAEYVVFVDRDAAGMVTPARMTTGIEVASSPIATLPALGSLASVADLGNNAGQIIGVPVALELLARPVTLICKTRVATGPVVSRTAEALPGGPATALAFAIAQAEQLGLPLQPGQFVSTGAVTGMHAVEPGQACRADFGDHGCIDCMITGREAGQ